MIKSHKLLKGSCNGQDVYIIGGGKSLDFIDSSFFEERITIGVNEAWKKFRDLSFNIHQHAAGVNNHIEGKVEAMLIVSEHECADTDSGILPEYNLDYFTYTHKAWRNDPAGAFKMQLECIGKDDDLLSISSIATQAIHLAAYMGAKNIFLAGIDCGLVDGKEYFDGYVKDSELKEIIEKYGTYEKYKEFRTNWLNDLEKYLIVLKNKIREVYGCNIVSINPFINLDLEGHTYSKKFIEAQEA